MIKKAPQLIICKTGEICNSYKEYMESEQWKISISNHKNSSLYDGKCAICKINSTTMHIHHKTYKRAGNERPGDLVCLCKNCHEHLHATLIKGDDLSDSQWSLVNRLRKVHLRKLKQKRKIAKKITHDKYSNVPIKAKNKKAENDKWLALNFKDPKIQTDKTVNDIKLNNGVILRKKI